MRVAILGCLVLLWCGIGRSTPVGMAKDVKAVPPPIAWNSALVFPLVHAEKAWRKRGVRLHRLRVFDRQMILTLRAPSRKDVLWAIDDLVKRPKLKERMADPARLFSYGAALDEDQPYEVDILLNGAHLKQEKPDKGMLHHRSLKPSADRLLKVARTAALNVQLSAQKHVLGTRTVDGKDYDRAVLTYRSATAEQILKLLFNVMSWGDVFCIAARWDGKSDAQKPNVIAGPATFELIRLRID